MSKIDVSIQSFSNLFMSSKFFSVITSDRMNREGR